MYSALGRRFFLQLFCRPEQIVLAAVVSVPPARPEQAVLAAVVGDFTDSFFNLKRAQSKSPFNQILVQCVKFKQSFGDDTVKSNHWFDPIKKTKLPFLFGGMVAVLTGATVTRVKKFSPCQYLRYDLDQFKSDCFAPFVNQSRGGGDRGYDRTKSRNRLLADRVEIQTRLTASCPKSNFTVNAWAQLGCF